MISSFGVLRTHSSIAVATFAWWPVFWLVCTNMLIGLLCFQYLKQAAPHRNQQIESSRLSGSDTI